MLRALSVRRSRRYERLVDESTIELLEVNLKRAKSVPASRVFGDKNKLAPLPELGFITKKAPEKPAAKKASKNVSHPLFSLFYGSRKRKTTAKPEFARYLEYVKEGGLWDTKSNMPVLYYK